MSDKLIKTNAAIIASASAVGQKEFEGPIGSFFDLHCPNDRFGKDTWEKSESEMQRMALNAAMKKANLKESELGALFAGDLLNQCIGSAYGLIDFDIPYFGLYGACSTSVEALMLSALCVTGGFFDICAAVTSSHNCTAERQYRNPIEYGGQKPQTAQWTVTGAGAFIVGKAGDVSIVSALPGIVIEMGINDTNNMGAAMAPAAASTVKRYFKLSGALPDDFDIICTGDLGYVGGDILCELLKGVGIDISKIYNDCGRIIFNRDTQDTHSGGSGCGCCASVLSSYIIPQFVSGRFHRGLVIATGAMMSPDSIKQGEAIPAVAHLIELRRNC